MYLVSYKKIFVYLVTRVLTHIAIIYVVKWL
jgi:hypothetical protein